MADEALRRPLDRVAAIVTWVVVPLCGGLWVLSRYRHTWYFYDEWAMVGRAASCSEAIRCATRSLNGHLWIVSYGIYWVQVRVFGIDGHAFVYGIFVASLILLHLSIARVLRSLRVDALVAVVAAGLVTYLGVGSQSMLFEVQVATNLASAFGFFAVAIALSRDASPSMIVAVSGLSVLAFACDSVTALLGLLFLAVAALARWTWRHVLVAITLPAVLHVIWLVHGKAGPTFDASLDARVRMVFRLLLRGAGGLVGGAARAGVVVALVATLFLVWGLRRRRYERSDLLVIAAGVLTALAAAILIAQGRTGIIGNNFVDFNRYIQTESMLLVLAIVPAIAHGVPAAWRRRAETSLVVVASGGFVIGLAPLLDYRSTFEGWNQRVEADVRSAVVLLDDGCPNAGTVDLDALPAGDFSPQFSMRLVDRLHAHGWLSSGDAPLSSDVVARVCR